MSTPRRGTSAIPAPPIVSADGCVHGLFFFQAEDGIRDLTVTGVQTCALPILAVGFLEVGGDLRDELVRGEASRGGQLRLVADPLLDPSHGLERTPEEGLGPGEVEDRKSVV